MPVTFNFRPGQAKRDRGRQWEDLVRENPDLQRLQPDERNAAKAEYQKTGEIPSLVKKPSQLRIESGGKTETPMAGGGTSVQFPDTNVGFRPLRLGPDPVGFIDKASPGQVIFPAGGDRASRLHIIESKPEKPQATTRFWRVKNDGSMELVRSEPRTGATDEDRIIKTEDGPGGQTPKESPQQKAARQTLAIYDQALKTGKGLNPDLEQRAAEAARFLGLPVQKVIQKPGFWADLFGAEPQTFERPAFSDDAPPPPAPAEYGSQNDIRAAYKSGKITKQEALRLMGF